MSLVRKLSYHDDLLLDKEKILLNNDKIIERPVGILQAPDEAEIQKWVDSYSTEVKILRDWLRKQPHLPQNIGDEQILMFYHSCYDSIEQTKAKIDAYFTIRTHAPEIFHNRNIRSQEVLKAQRVTRISPLRCGTPEGYNVIYIDSLDADVANFNFTEAMKLASIAIDVLVRSYPYEKGNVLVFDMKRSALAHVIKTNLTILRKSMIYVQKAIPFRFKQVHIINAFPLVQQIQLLVKPFIDEKLSKVIYIHMQDSMETFYEFIPKKSLPKEYGGEAESLEDLNQKLNEMISYHEPFLKKLETFVVDESKRPGKSQSSNDVFGMEGSFRKLEID